MLQLHEISQLQIELTTRCNSRCPMCMRNYRGLEYNSGYPLTELSLDDVKRILPPEFLKQIKHVLFNGNLGDFGLAKDGVEIVRYLVENKVPTINIYSNGSMRTPDWWAQLALPGVKVGFALDGLADTHSLYRQDTDWNTIIKNAQAYIAAGGEAIWRFIPFKHNQHQEETCRQLANELGFKYFNNIGDGRNNGPVYTRTGDFSHWLGDPWDDTMKEPDIVNMVQSHITWYDVKTVRSSKDITPVNIGCNHIRNRELYIAANGEIYPCCYLGYYPQTMHHPGNEQLKPLVQRNNAKEYSLEECIRWFDQVEETWDKPSIAEGRLYTCVNTCGSWKQPTNKQTL
jgi:MoaA/NifB/PqqE/SkfB family radical SAM enzyme